MSFKYKIIDIIIAHLKLVIFAIGSAIAITIRIAPGTSYHNQVVKAIDAQRNFQGTIFV